MLVRLNRFCSTACGTAWRLRGRGFALPQERPDDAPRCRYADCDERLVTPASQRRGSCLPCAAYWAVRTEARRVARQSRWMRRRLDAYHVFDRRQQAAEAKTAAAVIDRAASEVEPEPLD